jgi:transposase-like protein
MAAGLHGSARATPRVRGELQAAQGSTRALAARFGLNPKTVAKWRRRTSTSDLAMGPRRPCSSVLTEAEEALVVEFRRRTLLPLDDVLGCLRDAIPKLTRSALHRCLMRHGISRLPRDDERASKRKGSVALLRAGTRGSGSDPSRYPYILWCWRLMQQIRAGRCG